MPIEAETRQGWALELHRLTDTGDDPLGDRLERLGIAATNHDNHEFITTDPGRAVLGPKLFAQDAAHAFQHEIARRVAKRIVHGFEEVEVHVQEAETGPCRAKAAPGSGPTARRLRKPVSGSVIASSSAAIRAPSRRRFRPRSSRVTAALASAR